MDGGNPLQLGKLLVILGLMLALAGLLVMAGSKLSFFGLGKLPGDIAFKGKNISVYFPVVTCLILSVVATLVTWLVSWFMKR